MFFSPLRWLWPAGLLLTIPLVQLSVQAQTISAPVTPAAPLKYHPAIGQYHGFKDQPIVSWRDANDTVSKAGANGSSQPAPTEKTSAPAMIGHGTNGAMVKGMPTSPMNHGAKP